MRFDDTKEEEVDVIFLDYAKAFDTVPHIRLGNPIETFDISGNLLAWIKAFLTGRRQRVVVNSALSPWTPVTSRRKTRTKIADLRINSGAFTSDDLDEADILNQQYANIFTRASVLKMAGE